MSDKIYEWKLNKFSDDLQKSLEMLYNKTKNNDGMFRVTYENVTFDCIIQYLYLKSWRLHFYRIIFDFEQLPTRLYPLKISFVDLMTQEIGDSAYIDNIRACQLTGTQMVELGKLVIKTLGGRTVYLFDGSRIEYDDGEFPLSEYKLFTTGKTFYEKLGFEIVPTIQIHYGRFKSADDFHKLFDEALNNIRNITCRDIVTMAHKILKVLNDAVVSYKDVKFYYISSRKILDSDPISAHVSPNMLQVKEIYDNFYMLALICEQYPDEKLIDCMKHLVDAKKYAAYNKLRNILITLPIARIDDINIFYREWFDFIDYTSHRYYYKSEL